jgi:hypothetical protein
MNILDLTTQQLRRAVSIKEQIDELTNELKNILGAADNTAGTQNGNRLSAAARSRIAAAQKARWAKARKAKVPQPSTKSVVKKSRMSAAARAKASSRMKAYWAAKKSAKRKSGKK